MTTSEPSRYRRNELLPIAIVEHHLLRDRVLSAYDIAEKLVTVQDAIADIHAEISLNRDAVVRINTLVTTTLGQSDGLFVREDEWNSLLEMIQDCGGFAGDPAHMSGWIFSALYWDHLTVCQFSTAWLYVDAIRMQHQLPKLKLHVSDVGRYLRALSGSGPPINDGQTFFPDEYGD